MLEREIDMSCRAAVVTTVADASEHIEFFINYHLYIGFEHIYVFIDDACQLTYEKVNANPRVTAIMAGEHLQDLRSLVPIYRDRNKRAILASEVMARQEMNIFVAESLARIKGYEWLLHIDIDELFFCNGMSLFSHISHLKQDGVGSFNHLNYEAIPHKIDVVEDADKLNGDANIYTATQYFKVNFFKKWHWNFNEKQKKFIEENSSWLPKLYFNYYQNGKSLVNIRTDICVKDVHSLHANGLISRNGSHADPLILHFPCVTFREYKKKYKRLGGFGDLWKGVKRAGKYIDTFHLDSRDKWLNHTDEEIKSFYTQRVLADKQQIYQLMSLGMAAEINDVVNISQGVISANNNVDKSPEPFRDILSHATAKPCEIPPAIELGTAFSIGQSDRIAIDANGITFNSLADARYWLRRHPDKKEMQVVQPIEYSPGRYCCVRDGSVLLDIDLIICKKSLNNALRDGNVLLPRPEFLHLKNHSGLSMLEYRARCYKMLKNLVLDCISNVGPAYKHQAIYQYTSEYENVLIDLIDSVEQNPAVELPLNFDENLQEALTESLSALNAHNFNVYIQGRYPRTAKINWVVWGEKAALDELDQVLMYAILLFLGGTQLVSEDSEISAVKGLIAQRQHYTELTRHYAEPFLSEHEQLICLRKPGQSTNFVCIANVSNKDAYISKSQLQAFAINGTWLSLTESKELHLNDDFYLKPKSYYWLKREQ